MEPTTNVVVRFEDGESERHIDMKRIVANGLAHWLPETEVPFRNIRRRADIVVRPNHISHPVIIECQHSKMAIREFSARQRDYRQCGLLIWIFERRVIDPVISRPLEIGYERPVERMGQICKAAYALIAEQGFIHVMEGETVIVVALQEYTKQIYHHWTSTYEERQYVRVTGLRDVAPPFDIALRGGLFPMLTEHYL